MPFNVKWIILARSATYAAAKSIGKRLTVLVEIPDPGIAISMLPGILSEARAVTYTTLFAANTLVQESHYATPPLQSIVSAW
ncbi:MAG: hypothetical protein KAV00_02050 [Phycisphaerae bacterium]|nr:hypothetical protein [Phycisphaerae bacterium]